MRNGEGCTKGIACEQCAHFLFNCTGQFKPSKLPKSPQTQRKRFPLWKNKTLHWADIS